MVTEKIAFSFHIVGCGGTGGYFLKEFSSFISGRRFLRASIAALHLYDGDIIEAKNLVRQKCFTSEDIGEYKSEVLAQILNDRDFADARDVMYWQNHNTYITRENGVIEKIIAEETAKGFVPIIVSCVDNHGCRLYLEEVISKLKSAFYVDTANGEEGAGSVFFTIMCENKKVGKFRSDVFADMHEDEREIDEISCEELNNAKPQHQFTNMASAMQAVIGVTNLLEKGSFPIGAVFFNNDVLSSTFVEYK